MPNLSIAVLGTGRMGQEILRALARADDLQLVGVWARPGSELYGQDMSAVAGPTATGVVANDDLAAIVSAADVAIDFTLPDAGQAVLDTRYSSPVRHWYAASADLQRPRLTACRHCRQMLRSCTTAT